MKNIHASKIVAILLVVCAMSSVGKATSPDHRVSSNVQKGKASYYGPGFEGQKTASGEIYDQDDLTAAHPTYPLGTKVTVKNLKTKRSVNVRINDRGPYKKGRIIDLSKGAAKKLGMTKDGVTTVEVVPLQSGSH